MNVRREVALDSVPSTGERRRHPTLLVVTGAGLRHRLFLGLVRRELAPCWRRTLIQQAGGRRGQRAQGDHRLGSRNVLPRLRRFASLGRRRWNRFRLEWFGAPVSLESLLWLPDANGEEIQLIREEMGDVEALPLEAAPGLKCVDDPNAPDVYRWLLEAPPDLILVFGGKILSGPWLEAARLGALNMHYGRLPYYRNARSTQFALFQERFDRIGATVHYLDEGVDTGPVVCRTALAIDGPSSLARAISRVYGQGIKALVDCGAASLRRNERLPAESAHEPGSYYTSAMSGPVTLAIAETRAKWAGRWPVAQPAVERQLARRSPPSLRGVWRRRAGFEPGVYIFLYHSIVDEQTARPWELSYDKVSVLNECFTAQMEFLARQMTPLALTEAPAVLARGRPDRAYAVVTFDDGYENVVRHAPAVLRRFGIRPALFVSSAFSSGRVYYRVLVSMLTAAGHARILAAHLRRRLSGVPWSEDGAELFRQTKNHYVKDAVEAAVEAASAECFGDALSPGVHLSVSQVRALAAQGWQIGTHTVAHQPLATLTLEEVDQAIRGDREWWASAGVELVSWVSYPNGRSTDVNAAVKTWMDRHPDLHGLFGAGGVNLVPSRTEWLRIPVSRSETTVDAFREKILLHLKATKLAWCSLSLGGRAAGGCAMTRRVMADGGGASQPGEPRQGGAPAGGLEAAFGVRADAGRAEQA